MRLLVTMSERSTMAPVCLWSRQASARAQVTTAIQLQLSTIVGITNETHDHLEPERNGETTQGVAASPSGSSPGAATTAGCSLSAAGRLGVGCSASWLAGASWAPLGPRKPDRACMSAMGLEALFLVTPSEEIKTHYSSKLHEQARTSATYATQSRLPAGILHSPGSRNLGPSRA